MSGETMLEFRERAMSLVAYEPKTGIFRWKVRRNSFGGPVNPGDVAGTVNKDGYVVINFGGKLWRGQRLAWLFMTGHVPESGMEIDHRNGNRADNRWDNLRKAKKSQNMWNAKTPSTNTSGVKGVFWRKNRSRWLAQIKADGKQIYVGTFEKFEDAVAARKAAESKYHGEYARKAA